MAQVRAIAAIFGLILVCLGLAGHVLAQTPGGTPQRDTPPPQQPSRNPDTQSGQTSGASVGVQIDVGQVIGGLSKLQKERKERRRLREEAAAAAAATAATASAAAILPKADDNVPAPVPKQAAPARPDSVAASQEATTTVSAPKPVVVFTPGSQLRPKTKTASVPTKVVPIIVPPVKKPTVKTLSVNVSQAVADRSLPKLKAIPIVVPPRPKPPQPALVRPLVAAAPIETMAPPQPISLGVAPAIVAQTQPLTVDPAPVAPAVIEPVSTPETENVAKKGSGLLWPLLGLLSLGTIGGGFVWARARKTASRKDTQLEKTITGQGIADPDPVTTLVFADGNDLLPAIVAGPGEVTTDLTFQDAVAN